MRWYSPWLFWSWWQCIIFIEALHNAWFLHTRESSHSMSKVLHSHLQSCIPRWSILSVTFKDDETKSKFLELYRVEAEYVRDYEMNTLSYEFAESDKDPLRGILIERFISKDDYLRHKQSPTFVSFRQKLQRLQDERLVTLKGGSFIESNIGFVWLPRKWSRDEVITCDSTHISIQFVFPRSVQKITIAG